jgi:hypothetical protein
MKNVLAILLLLLLSATAFGAGSTSNTLQWDYLAADVTLYGVTAFNIERKTEACAGAAAFAEIATAVPTARIYDDLAISPGLTYCYRMAATGAGGKSAYSNTVAKTVPFAVPVVPGGLRVL